MKIHDVLRKSPGHRPRKRRGRGNGSGLGCTAGRGHKGALARAGWSTRYGYEGGQMPIARRLPKRGFKNTVFATRYDVINLASLDSAPAFADGDTVDLESLKEKLGFRARAGRLKVLGTGNLSKKLAVVAEKFSRAAQQKIEAAGGSCTVRHSRGKGGEPNPKNKQE